MKSVFPFTVSGIGCKVLTTDQAAALFTQAEAEAGQKHGGLRTIGPWQLPIRYRAIAATQDFHSPGSPMTVLGFRTMSSIKESGNQLEGRVSVSGKMRRAFTSSQLFQFPDGKLVDCAIIHVCI